MGTLQAGLQLYTVRQALSEDMAGTLQKVKAMGYDYVEFSGGRYGRSAEETRKLLDDAGLRCISVHQSPSFFQNDPQDAVDYVKTLGAEFAVIPVVRLPAYQEDWVGTIDLFQQMTDAFAAAGIRLLYHNHDHEMTTLPGDPVRLLDRILEAVPGLAPEFDTCWVSYGGVDPIQYLTQYAGQLDIVHLKDYRCCQLPERPIWQLLQEGYERPEKRSLCGFRYEPVGCGVENWQGILAATAGSGARYVVVEQDESKDRDSLEAAALSRRYLREEFGI